MKKFALILVGIFAFASLSAFAADGEAVYKNNCTKCHKEGNKSPKAGDLKNLKTNDAAKIQKIITREEKYDGKEHKKDFKGKLSDEEMAAVTAFVASKAGK